MARPDIHRDKVKGGGATDYPDCRTLIAGKGKKLHSQSAPRKDDSSIGVVRCKSMIRIEASWKIWKGLSKIFGCIRFLNQGNIDV